MSERRSLAAGVLMECGAMAVGTSLAHPPTTSSHLLYFNVGTEDLQTGTASYALHIASARPVSIGGIQRLASAALLPGTRRATNIIRQTQAVTCPVAPKPRRVHFSGLPSFKRKEYSLASDLLDFKRIRSSVAETPSDMRVPGPIPIARNTLIVHFAQQTYNVGGVDASPVQYLDREPHLMMCYRG